MRAPCRCRRHAHARAIIDRLACAAAALRVDLTPGPCQFHPNEQPSRGRSCRHPVQGRRHLGCDRCRRRGHGAHDGDELESAGAGRACRPGGSSRLLVVHLGRAAGGMVLRAPVPGAPQRRLRLRLRGGDPWSACRAGCRVDAARDLSLLCHRRSRRRRSVRRQPAAAPRSLARCVEPRPDDAGRHGGGAAEHRSRPARRPGADHSRRRCRRCHGADGLRGAAVGRAGAWTAG